MTPFRRPAEALGRLRAILGVPGLLIGWFAFLSFGFGLYVLASEYNRPRRAAHYVSHLFLRSWARTPNYLGLTLLDYVDSWRNAPPDRRDARRAMLREALRDLGDELARQNERFPLFRIVSMEVRPPGGGALADWSVLSASTAPAGTHLALRDAIPLADAAGGEGDPGAIDLVVLCQVSPTVERGALGLETSYHRLLLAVLGLSGYSLLCLAYMIFHARALSEQVAREAAQEAALDLADRTCHELGNGVFVLANERKNLNAHLDLIDRFVAEDAEAQEAAARRLGIGPELATRWEHALRREYAARGIDPDLEIRGSAAMARQVCRQIAVCSEYIALTVRELDGFLKRTPLPVALEPVAVAEVFDEALALLGPRLEAAEARVEHPDRDEHPLRVRADRRLLVHALVNLLKNALEAAASRGIDPRITLSAREEGGTVWIEVADNGPGIPDPDLRRVFDSGFSTKGPGRGRGLAIVHESVQLLGGQIRVASRPGEGTRFAIGLGGRTRGEE